LGDSGLELNWSGFGVLDFYTTGTVGKEGINDFDEVGVEAKGNEFLY
jgi:hypothetical protein